MSTPFRYQKINYDLLKEAGYKRYEQKIREASALWQKNIKDKNGIKYSITFFEYDWSKLVDSSTNIISFEPSVQFEVDENSCVNVDFLFSDDHTIEHIEKFYDKMFVAMNFKYSEPKSCSDSFENFEVCND